MGDRSSRMMSNNITDNITLKLIRWFQQSNIPVLKKEIVNFIKLCTNW